MTTVTSRNGHGNGYAVGPTLGTADRIPPQNLEAEMALLGSILVDRAMLDFVEPIAQPKDCYAYVHDSIYAVILALAARNEPIDKISVAEELRRRDLLEKTGGIAYLSSLMETVPTAASAEYYARLVREKAILRGLIHAGTQITKIGYEYEEDVDAGVRTAESALRSASERGATVAELPWILLGQKRLYDRIAWAYDHPGEHGQITPWKGINELVGGFRPGNLVIFGAGPKVGKTALAVTLTYFIAYHYGAVPFFGIEMGEEAINARFLALLSEISVRRQLDGDIKDHDWPRIAVAQNMLAKRPILIFGSDCNSLIGIRRALRKTELEYGAVAAFVLDYVNFLADVDGAGDKSSTKHDRLDWIYREILRIAGEFRAVAYVIQHVNRKDGYDKPPTLANLRDGGNPEGHAHCVILPWREKQIGTAEERQLGQFIVAATREGDAGVVRMKFHGWRSLWLDEADARPFFDAEFSAELHGENRQVELPV